MTAVPAQKGPKKLITRQQLRRTLAVPIAAPAVGPPREQRNGSEGASLGPVLAEWYDRDVAQAFPPRHGLPRKQTIHPISIIATILFAAEITHVLYSADCQGRAQPGQNTRWTEISAVAEGKEGC
jgi:hypothetical protein